jgi:hypothetical protein
MVKGLLFRAPLKLARAQTNTATKAGYPPSGATDEHIAAINRRPEVLNELSGADVFVRSMDAINDRPLKNGLRIETAGVYAIPAMAVGAPVLCNHDTGMLTGLTGLPIGRVFSARPSRRDSGVWAELDFWMTATDDNADLVRRIDSGNIAEVSVSFGYSEMTCSICDTDMAACAHWPGELYDGKTCEGIISGVNEFYEVSLVWQGMANGTRLKMAAGRFDTSSDLVTAFPEKPRTHGLAAIFARRGSGSLEHLYGKKAG